VYASWDKKFQRKVISDWLRSILGFIPFD
jgi:hypothetical protein